MESSAASLERVQLLLDALVMERGALPRGSIGNAAGQWVVEWLRLDPLTAIGPSRIAHLVAIQLAPRAAIDYSVGTPATRWRIVARYLEDRFALHDEECERIARLVATTLDAADARRGREHIPATQSAEQCAICRLPFRREPESVATRDPFKPIWLAEQELTRPEMRRHRSNFGVRRAHECKSAGDLPSMQSG